MTDKQAPRRASDIEANISRLSGIINGLRPLADQYEKLKAAAKGIKEAEQEVQALRAELAESQAYYLRAEADSLRVLRIAKTDERQESILSTTYVEIEQSGYSQNHGCLVPQVRRVPLHTLNAAETIAVAESGKLPAHVLKLANAPAEALKEWAAGYRRGYLIG